VARPLARGETGRILRQGDVMTATADSLETKRIAAKRALGIGLTADLSRPAEGRARRRGSMVCARRVLLKTGESFRRRAICCVGVEWGFLFFVPTSLAS
jgi:hypothetical protein